MLTLICSVQPDLSYVRAARSGREIDWTNERVVHPNPRKSDPLIDDQVLVRDPEHLVLSQVVGSFAGLVVANHLRNRNEIAKPT